MRSLIEIQRRPVNEVVGSLLADSHQQSVDAASKLIGNANEFGLNLRDYLTLAVEPDETQRNAGLNGYEAALAHLNLPFRNDFSEGVLLAQSSETFKTYAGTRALFPEVIDDMLQWTYRQDQVENVQPLLAGSRTTNQTEVLYTVVDDKQDDYESYTVSELGRVPMRTIRTSEATVKFYKHGSGIRTSYEFERRARLDILTPFAARVSRELELSKVRAATNVLVNGDGTPGSAANVANQSTYDSGATNGQISYKGLLKWLVARAKAGTPVDTVVGNWDALVQWMMLFTPTLTGDFSQQQALASAGGPSLTFPNVLGGRVEFVLSSAMPNNQLLGMTRQETLEELVEANANIQESERMIQNQAINYVKTETTGYRLVYKDTREVYDFNN